MRVVAGDLGGRKLLAPRGRDTRPTPERVREALFSALEARLGGPGSLTGVRVLDLFAGSGALGIEALSRGAARAVFVERERAALAALGKNLEELGLRDRSRVLPGAAAGALEILARGGERFDVVFVDPPYASGEAETALVKLTTSGVVREGGWIAVEHSSRVSAPRPPGPSLSAEPTRRYGSVALTLYTRAARHAEAPPAGAEDGS